MLDNARSDIAFFGSSLRSAYWNGAGTYYRGLLRAMHEAGHHITFYEPDAFDRQKHRDLDDISWAEVVVYPATSDDDAMEALTRAAQHADVIVKASGIGVFDRLLEREVLSLRTDERRVIFWDVDAPATLHSIAMHPDDPLRERIPHYDMVLTYGGGQPVIEAYLSLGARQCVPIYNALDPSTHYPVAKEPEYECDLAFLGNRLPDREERVDEFFFKPANAMPSNTFLLGGSGWGDKCMPANIKYAGHVYTHQHNAFNCSPRAVLNISRSSMARMGFSPATRVFEAAGAGACLITDAWEGIEQFLEPGVEVLVARHGDDVVKLLRWLSPADAREIGEAARKRILANHTYAHRAAQVTQLLAQAATPVAMPAEAGMP